MSQVTLRGFGKTILVDVPTGGRRESTFAALLVAEKHQEYSDGEYAPFDYDAHLDTVDGFHVITEGTTSEECIRARGFDFDIGNTAE